MQKGRWTNLRNNWEHGVQSRKKGMKLLKRLECMEASWFWLNRKKCKVIWNQNNQGMEEYHADHESYRSGWLPLEASVISNSNNGCQYGVNQHHFGGHKVNHQSHDKREVNELWRKAGFLPFFGNQWWRWAHGVWVDRQIHIWS